MPTIDAFFAALQPEWKKITFAVWETVEPLCQMGAQLKALLKTLNTIVLWWSAGFEGGPEWELHDAGDASLSDSYTSNRDCFHFPSKALLHI